MIRALSDGLQHLITQPNRDSNDVNPEGPGNLQHCNETMRLSWENISASFNRMWRFLVRDPIKTSEKKRDSECSACHLGTPSAHPINQRRPPPPQPFRLADWTAFHAPSWGPPAGRSPRRRSGVAASLWHNAGVLRGSPNAAVGCLDPALQVSLFVPFLDRGRFSHFLSSARTRSSLHRLAG